MAKNERESVEAHVVQAKAVWHYVEFPVDVGDVIELSEAGDKTEG